MMFDVLLLDGGALDVDLPFAVEVSFGMLQPSRLQCVPEPFGVVASFDQLPLHLGQVIAHGRGADIVDDLASGNNETVGTTNGIGCGGT